MAVSPDDQTIVIRRSEAGETFWIAARFRSSGSVDLAEAAAVMHTGIDDGDFEIVLDTEHGEYAADPAAIDVDGTVVRFQRPGAIILKTR